MLNKCKKVTVIFASQNLHTVIKLNYWLGINDSDRKAGTLKNDALHFSKTKWKYEKWYNAHFFKLLKCKPKCYYRV